MKQILLFLLLLSFTITTMAQYADTTGYVPATDYLKKSKNQRTAAWIMVSGGALLSGIGLAVTAKDVDDIFTNAFGGADKKVGSAGEILIYSGLAVMAGSIPFFIAAGKSRRKAAASVSFKMENATIISQGVVSNNRYPAVTMQIRF